MMYRSLLILFLSLIISGINAQTMVWSLKPGDYSKISLLTKNIYKVEKNGMTGLITPTGKVVMPLSNAEIGDFYNGYAIVTSQEDSRNAIMGILTSDYQYFPFQEKYYTIDEMDFVSDGMIAAINSRGRVGYLNISGDPVLGFNGKYKMITPFSEGYACISSNGQTYDHLINKTGNVCSVDLGFQVVQGFFNVYNGNAVVYDTDGGFYSYDTRTNQTKRISAPKSAELDYLCCLKEISRRSDNVPFEKKSYSSVSTLTPTRGGDGLYGYYTKNGSVILPEQFDYASDVVDGYAIVKTKEGYGLLEYKNTSGVFAISAAKTHHVYTSERLLNCQFRLNLPEEWQNRALEVKISKNGNNVSATKTSSDTYVIEQNPNGLNSVLYDVTVSSDGIQLWSGSQRYTFEKKVIQNLRVSLHLINDKADKNDHCNVSATISNPGEESVTCHYNMTGSDTFVATSGSTTIPAGGSKVITGYFLVKKAAPKQWVKINITPGGSDTKTGLELIPFYTGF